MAEPKHKGVRKLADGLYGIDYRTPDGKRHRETVGSFKLAVQVYQARMAAIFEGRYRPAAPTRITFSELAAMALEAKRGRIAPLSYASDVQRTRTIEETLGSVLADKITSLDVEKVLSKVRQEASGPTANRYRSVLSSIFSYAVRNKLLLENPVRAVPAYEESEERNRYLTADEEAALRQAVREYCPDREPALDLLLHTGIRRGEWFSLQWTNVDLDHGLLTVEGEMTESGDYCKTGRHTIELNSIAIGALRELHATSKGSARVCPDTSYRRCVDWLEDSIAAANIDDFSCHDLRHTFGSRCIMKGISVRTVQRWMGHKSITTTMRYLHLEPSHLRAEIEKLVEPTGRQMDTSQIKTA